MIIGVLESLSSYPWPHSDIFKCLDSNPRLRLINSISYDGPIVEEVHRIRAKLLKEYHGDMKKIAEFDIPKLKKT